MNPDAIVTGLGVLFGGGTIAAVVQAIVSHQKGVRDADVARDQNAVSGFRDLAEELRKEVDRLKAARDEDRARMDRIEEQIKEERDLKWLSIRHIQTLYHWIIARMPGEVPPHPPEALSRHVIVPTSPPPPEQE